MTGRSLLCTAALAALIVAPAASALADCPPSCPVSGGKDPVTDCFSEFASTALKLNFPALNPAKPKPAKEMRCFDGDPGCDLDGTVNNECVFDIDVCLRNLDPALPACAPADVSASTVAGAKKSPELLSLQGAIDALLPATSNVCTSDQQLTVPLKQSSKGFKRGKGQVKIKTVAAGGEDKDRLKLSCVPHEWPSFGYNAANHRSTPLATKVDASTLGQLQVAWQFAISEPLALNASRGVTSTPTVDDKRVYITSWNGRVYALDRKTGKQKWSYDTGTSGQLGIQSSATLTADGRLVVGDSAGTVHCLDAKRGRLLWTASVGDAVLDSAHVWASPTVANGRVFVGRSSHNDQPCTRGHLYAFDLDTGAELWRTATVPEGICFDDTTIACTDETPCSGGGSPCVSDVCDIDTSQACTMDSQCVGLFGGQGTCLTSPACKYDTSQSCTVDADCPSCIPAVGGGVTATASTDATGETVYMASVGCLSFPSVGNSDAIFSLDAATGDINWVHRTQSIEQIADGPFYHDYGFLNGPLAVEVDDGLGGMQKLVVAGSKDGTIYAVDADTGSPVWTNELVPAPEFAEFGLFNAPIAFADGRFYASLFQMTNWPSGNDHLYAFDATDGGTEWSKQIGLSWGASTVANGLLYVGTQAATEFYAYDAATGARLRTFTLLDSVSGGAAVVDDTVYIPYGVFGNKGGVVAYRLPE